MSLSTIFRDMCYQYSQRPASFELRGDRNYVHVVECSGQLLNGIIDWDKTPMLMATFFGSPKLVHIFLSHGASLMSMRQTGFLHEAILGHGDERHKCEIARLLLDHGADVNHLDKASKTPLDRALHGGLQSLAELLREWGGS